jgi:DNA-binding NtrC family response regulator
MNTHLVDQQAGILSRDNLFRGARILVVDDDDEIRKLHAAILSLEGYEVETAEDGADALERLASRSFDLVFTDRLMPILNGENLLLALRSAGIRTPVVMVSGSLAHSPLPERVAREVSAVLPKPIRAREVLAAISMALHPFRPGLAVAA